VYLAHDQALSREVAIKILDKDAAGDQQHRGRFVKEARALAQMSHPNIVAVYDVGEVDGLPFIVMEHLPGSLKGIIERHGSLSVGDAIRIGSEIAQGLAAAHARNIIHADLKPSNILFDAQGRAKIADFGIARTPQDAASDTSQIFATAMYVAPERVEGHPATPASDIYGLGLIIYEMLIGKPPFTSSNVSVLLRDHVVRPPIPPSHLRTSLSRDLDAVVLKALSKDPGLRYRHAQEFAQALGKIPIDDPLAPETSRPEPIMRAPLMGIMPYRHDSPVVRLLASFARPIRRIFYSALLVLPLIALFYAAGVPISYAVVFAGLPAIMGLAGYLGLALAICWVLESLLLVLFVPAVAVLFVLVGLWVAYREYSAEQAILALAQPVLAPFGLAPALILTSTALHGIAGILATAWGAIMTVFVALAMGQPSTGPYVVTGLLFRQTNLFDTPRAVEARAAISDIVRVGGGNWEERTKPLAQLFDPQTVLDQVISLYSRFWGAELPSAIGTVFAWVLAAAMVWVITRLFRTLMDTAFQTRRVFALYVLATALGIFGGAFLLYGLFSTWAPLANAPDRSGDDALFLAAGTGAFVALAATVVIGATRPPEPTTDSALAEAFAAD